MSKPLFSVVMACYSELEPVQSGASGRRHFRAQTVQRAIKSIVAQQYKNWELIIIDDGIIDGITPRILDAFADMDKRIKVIHKEKNEGRCIARNDGMDAAIGEWLCWVDSDDEWTTNYLRVLEKAIRTFPDAKIFNFGTIIQWPDFKTEIRQTFKPEIEGKGCAWFPAGHIGAGSFIFRKDLWVSDKKYRIPDEASPFQFAAESRIPLRLSIETDKFKYENTENPDNAFQDGVMRQGVSLGNPVGDDYCQFYYLTRDNHTQPLDVALYIQYPRTSEDDELYFGEVFDVETK